MNTETEDASLSRGTLLLFVAGNAPRSRRAREALRQALEEHGQTAEAYQEIDLLEDPARILEYSVFATPALIRIGDGREPEMLYGDLSDSEKLQRLLN